MSVISRQELLDLKALMVSEKSAFGGCVIHEDVIQKSHEYELSLLDRAEKAEAKINKYHHEMMKAQMFIRDNGHTPSFIEYRKRAENDKIKREYEDEILPLKARAEKAEAENAQLKSWLDAVTDFAYYDNEHEVAICKYIVWREGQKNG